MDLLPKLIEGIIASLIAAIIAYVTKKIVLRYKWVENGRIILLRTLQFILILGSCYLLYLLSNLWVISGEELQYSIKNIFFVILALAIIGYWLHIFLKDLEQALSKQYGNQFFIYQKNPKKSKPEKIPLHRLRHSSHTNNRLSISWDTFGDGMCFLKNQITDYSPKVEPDLCIGINRKGMLIASYLAGTLHDGQRLVGFIRTSGEKREIVEESFPCNLGRIKSILIVDSEIKSGYSLHHIIEYLIEKFSPQGEKLDIKIAVFSACLIKEHIDKITDLETKGVFEHEYIDNLPDFLAFITAGRIKLPEGIT